MVLTGSRFTIRRGWNIEQMPVFSQALYLLCNLLGYAVSCRGCQCKCI